MKALTCLKLVDGLTQLGLVCTKFTSYNLNMKIKSILSIILKFLFAFGLIAWMITNGMLDLSSLYILAKPKYFIPAMTLVFLTIFLNNMRWTVLLRTNDFNVSYKQTLPLTLIGIFFNFALPSGVGGDLVKGYYLLKRSVGKKTVAATTLLMDRIIGMYGLLLLATAVMLVDYPTLRNRSELHVLTITVIGLFLLITLFFALAFSKTVINNPLTKALFFRLPGGLFLKSVYEAIHSYRTKPVALIQTMILSFLSHFSIIIFFWFFATISEAPDLPFYVYLFIVPICLISTVLPITPAGIGVGQAAIYHLYKLYTGIDSQIGPNPFTAFQVVLLCWGLFGVYFYVAEQKHSLKEAMFTQ